MKFLIFLAASLCLLSNSFAAFNPGRAQQLFNNVMNTPIVQSNPGLVEKVREKVKVKGCGVNLCFALDGSGSVGTDFQTQKDFVNLIAAIVGADDDSNFAATVYGLVNENISKLTSNAANFILDVTEAPFPAAPVTFISAGLGFCFNQLDDFPLQDDVNKIVLLGDGFSNFGDLTGPLAPVAIAQQWRDLNPPNNNLCAVAVGFSSTRALNAITGDPALVLKVTDWPVLLNILDTLVDNICFKYAPHTPHPTTTKPHVTTTKPHPTTTKPHITTKPSCPCKCYREYRHGSPNRNKSFRKARKDCAKPFWRHCKISYCYHSTFSHCCH